MELESLISWALQGITMEQWKQSWKARYLQFQYCCRLTWPKKHDAFFLLWIGTAKEAWCVVPPIAEPVCGMERAF